MQMNESKFFLKEFFKNHRSEVKSIEVLYDGLGKKLEPHNNQMKKALKRIGESDIINFNPKSEKEIYDEYQIYWERHKTVKEMPNRELKNLLSILFPNPINGVKKGLYDIPDRFDDFLNTLLHKNKQLYLRKLLSELLYHYPNNNKILFERLHKIYKFLDSEKRSHKPLFEANNRFHLIEKSGPSIIAKNILDLENSLDTLLPELWIKERHLINGIGRQIIEELCQQVQLIMNRFFAKDFSQTDKKILERFLEYLSGGENQSGSSSSSSDEDSNKVRFSDSRSSVVRILLNSFKDRKPEGGIKTIITRFLDRYVGDPRFHSERWIAMQEEKDIFLRWKIGDTIKDFLDLLDDTATKDPAADRMWPYRKKFIKSYLKEGHITDAWIVLGKEAFKNRKKFLHKNAYYGEITKGANRMHSALIYKIGNLVMSEWNYNGPVRIWNEEDKYAPKFYQKKYLRDDLINKPDESIIHRSSDTYSWQKKLSEYIYDYADIPCPKNLQRKINKFY